jgi:S-adenosylmethionine synthetase
MLNLQIQNQPKIKHTVEIVDRKGLGHPDTICDLVVDHLSIRLSQIYQKQFGAIPHFNIDKALLCAGQTENRFGGGKIIKPMLFVIGDRATEKLGRKKIDLEKIIKREIYAFLKNNYRFIDEKSFIIESQIKPGSASLQDIFQRQAKYLPANDTSALVGYFPLTKLEQMVFETERFVNSKTFKKRYPQSGEDVKVMGWREGKIYRLILAIAFVDRFVKSEEDYFKKKEEMKKAILSFIRKKFEEEVTIEINTLDRRGAGVFGCYLTVTGTSADSGDSGEVGRGNRANGLIPLNRVAGSEASAGKNCVSHVGKIYNLLSFKLAKEIYRILGKRTTVWLISKIGQPVNQPALTSVEVEDLEKTEIKKIEKIVAKNFNSLDRFIKNLVIGKYRSQ